MKSDTRTNDDRRRRLRLWSREIIVAVALTLAALVFIAIALVRGGATPVSMEQVVETMSQR